MKSKSCLKCEKPYSSNDKDSKFCSRSCSGSFNGQNRRQHGFAPLNCLFCGVKLDESRRKFCSRTHATAYKLKINFEAIGQDINPFKDLSNNSSIKRLLIKIRSHKCEICATKKWLEKPVPLVLDHIDGNSENSKPSNLQLVCGNCNMLLPTFGSRNRGNGRWTRRQRYTQGKSS
jgi:hypothetical protein